MQPSAAPMSRSRPHAAHLRFCGQVEEPERRRVEEFVPDGAEEIVDFNCRRRRVMRAEEPGQE